MAKIKIGNVWSLRTPESWEYRPDDRQERIELIGDVIVQDEGHVARGDIIACTAVFKKVDWENSIKGYWKNRTRVTVSDESGQEWHNARVVLKSYKYYDKFPKYVILTLEFWFCNEEQIIFEVSENV